MNLGGKSRSPLQTLLVFVEPNAFPSMLTLVPSLSGVTIPMYLPYLLFTGQYFEATIVLLALSTALTVVIINIHHRGKFNNQVPFWIRKLVLDWLARPLRLKATVDAHLTEAKSNKVELADMLKCVSSMSCNLTIESPLNIILIKVIKTISISGWSRTSFSL